MATKKSPEVRSAAGALRELRAVSTPARAKVNAWFFKSGKGEYAEGDRFLGVTVPLTREVAKHCSTLSLSEVKKLLRSPWHEARLLAIFILEKKLVSDLKEKNFGSAKKLVRFYIQNISYVNNWDLVDSSAAQVLGRFVMASPERADQKWVMKLLSDWSRSDHLWKKRVSIVATMAFIRTGWTGPTWKTAKVLLKDPHDLIHKATGWLLREAGKKDPRGLEQFLGAHVGVMPRTMLRYAIERLSPTDRKFWLSRPRTNAHYKGP